MLYAFLAWFFFLFFKYGLWGYQTGKIALPMLPDIHMERILWASLFSILFFGLTTRKIKFDIGITRLEVAMALLCLYILASMIISGTFYSAGKGLTLGYLLSGYFIPFSSFFLAKYIATDEQKIKKLFIFFAIMGFYSGITGIFEYFRLDLLVFPGYIMDPEIGIHWGRARGPLLESPGNGWQIGICFFITLHLLLNSKTKWTKIFYSISIVSILSTLLFTFTRNIWLGFAVAILAMPIFLPQIRKIFIVSSLALLLLFGSLLSLGKFKQHDIDDSDFGEIGVELSLTDKLATRGMKKSTITGRFAIYRIGWKMFSEKPVFGFGFATSKVLIGHSIHDSLVEILVELGLVGMSLYLFIIINILIISIRLYRQLPLNAFIGKEIVVVFFGMFILYNIVIEFAPFVTLTYPLSIFYCMAGIIVGLSQRVSKQKISEKLNWRVQESKENMQVEKYG